VAVLTGVSPVLLVADLQRSVDYFSDRLGFECHLFGDPPNFATAARDAAVILIALSDEPARLVPHWQIVDKMWDAYIRVDDVDAIYAEVQDRGAGIDYTIYDAPHGFREFGVQDPDGHDIAFGQPLEP
jgi:catechol 2,3-dioxygenase-like lactoylglutathione lyase family enzyme